MLLLAALMMFDHPADKYISFSTMTGGVLASACQIDRGLEADTCTSYILGVADALQRNRVTCRPQSDAGTIQPLAIARRYIKDHPERWNVHGSMLVQEALVQAFPCPYR